MGKKKEPRKKKSLGTMDIILIIVFVALVIFTVEMIREFRLYGSIPDTLCTCVFVCLGGECGIMGWIKTTKERRREREYELEDREEQKKESAEAESPGTITTEETEEI